jgi:hypothetical protein
MPHHGLIRSLSTPSLSDLSFSAEQYLGCEETRQSVPADLTERLSAADPQAQVCGPVQLANVTSPQNTAGVSADHVEWQPRQVAAALHDGSASKGEAEAQQEVQIGVKLQHQHDDHSMPIVQMESPPNFGPGGNHQPRGRSLQPPTISAVQPSALQFHVGLEPIRKPPQHASSSRQPSNSSEAPHSAELAAVHVSCHTHVIAAAQKSPSSAEHSSHMFGTMSPKEQCWRNNDRAEPQSDRQVASYKLTEGNHSIAPAQEASQLSCENITQLQQGGVACPHRQSGLDAQGCALHRGSQAPQYELEHVYGGADAQNWDVMAHVSSLTSPQKMPQALQCTRHSCASLDSCGQGSAQRTHEARDTISPSRVPAYQPKIRMQDMPEIAGEHVPFPRKGASACPAVANSQLSLPEWGTRASCSQKSQGKYQDKLCDPGSGVEHLLAQNDGANRNTVESRGSKPHHQSSSQSLHQENAPAACVHNGQPRQRHALLPSRQHHHHTSEAVAWGTRLAGEAVNGSRIQHLPHLPTASALDSKQKAWHAAPTMRRSQREGFSAQATQQSAVRAAAAVTMHNHVGGRMHGVVLQRERANFAVPPSCEQPDITVAWLGGGICLSPSRVLAGKELPAPFFGSERGCSEVPAQGDGLGLRPRCRALPLREYRQGSPLGVHNKAPSTAWALPVAYGNDSYRSGIGVSTAPISPQAQSMHETLRQHTEPISQHVALPTPIVVGSGGRRRGVANVSSPMLPSEWTSHRRVPAHDLLPQSGMIVQTGEQRILKEACASLIQDGDVLEVEQRLQYLLTHSCKSVVQKVKACGLPFQAIVQHVLKIRAEQQLESLLAPQARVAEKGMRDHIRSELHPAEAFGEPREPNFQHISSIPSGTSATAVAHLAKQQKLARNVFQERSVQGAVGQDPMPNRVVSSMVVSRRNVAVPLPILDGALEDRNDTALCMPSCNEAAAVPAAWVLDAADEHGAESIAVKGGNLSGSGAVTISVAAVGERGPVSNLANSSCDPCSGAAPARAANVDVGGTVRGSERFDSEAPVTAAVANGGCDPCSGAAPARAANVDVGGTVRGSDRSDSDAPVTAADVGKAANLSVRGISVPGNSAAGAALRGVYDDRAFSTAAGGGRMPKSTAVTAAVAAAKDGLDVGTSTRGCTVSTAAEIVTAGVQSSVVSTAVRDKNPAGTCVVTPGVLLSASPHSQERSTSFTRKESPERNAQNTPVMNHKRCRPITHESGSDPDFAGPPSRILKRAPPEARATNGKRLCHILKPRNSSTLSLAPSSLPSPTGADTATCSPSSFKRLHPSAPLLGTAGIASRAAPAAFGSWARKLEMRRAHVSHAALNLPPNIQKHSLDMQGLSDQQPSSVTDKRRKEVPSQTSSQVAPNKEQHFASSPSKALQDSDASPPSETREEGQQQAVAEQGVQQLSEAQVCKARHQSRRQHQGLLDTSAIGHLNSTSMMLPSRKLRKRLVLSGDSDHDERSSPVHRRQRGAVSDDDRDEDYNPAEDLEEAQWAPRKVPGRDCIRENHGSSPGIKRSSASDSELEEGEITTDTAELTEFMESFDSDVTMSEGKIVRARQHGDGCKKPSARQQGTEKADTSHWLSSPRLKRYPRPGDMLAGDKAWCGVCGSVQHISSFSRSAKAGGASDCKLCFSILTKGKRYGFRMAEVMSAIRDDQVAEVCMPMLAPAKCGSLFLAFISIHSHTFGHSRLCPVWVHAPADCTNTLCTQ